MEVSMRLISSAADGWSTITSGKVLDSTVDENTTAGRWYGTVDACLSSCPCACDKSATEDASFASRLPVTLKLAKEEVKRLTTSHARVDSLVANSQMANRTIDNQYFKTYWSVN